MNYDGLNPVFSCWKSMQDPRASVLRLNPRRRQENRRQVSDLRRLFRRQIGQNRPNWLDSVDGRPHTMRSFCLARGAVPDFPGGAFSLSAPRSAYSTCRLVFAQFPRRSRLFMPGA
jgi:hypothetical protein